MVNCVRASIFFIFITSLNLFARCDLEFTQFHHLSGGRKAEELIHLNIGTYNVLNLEFSPGRYLDDVKTGQRKWVPERLDKNPEDTKRIADIILGEKLDLVVLQEVEGLEAIKLFNKNYLDDHFEIFLHKGNDTRGIEIAILVKKDLPFKVKFTTNQSLEWSNKISKKTENIFSRDLPALHIWKQASSGADPPEYIILGNHLKSQRDRAGDPRSVSVRTKQAEEISNIVRKYEQMYPDTPVIVGGDFNSDIHSGKEFTSLFEDNLLTDSFDLLGKEMSKEQRYTHTFHPRGAQTVNTQLDGILVNKAGQNLIKDAKVYRYKDKAGSVLPLPKTYSDRELNPSDHFPIIVQMLMR